jgi:hypothetical protein
MKSLAVLGERRQECSRQAFIRVTAEGDDRMGIGAMKQQTVGYLL